MRREFSDRENHIYILYGQNYRAPHSVYAGNVTLVNADQTPTSYTL